MTDFEFRDLVVRALDALAHFTDVRARQVIDELVREHEKDKRDIEEHRHG